MQRLCLLLASIWVVQGSILPFLQIPKHDGVKRVCRLTAENFTSIVTAADTAIVVIKDPQSSRSSVCPTELDTFAEVTAQVLRKKNSIVCETVSSVFDVSANTNLVNPGDVYVYKNGKGSPYYGKRSSKALLNYLFKVNNTQVKLITGKLDKIAFDAVEEVKVVGFFMPGAADHLAFEAAASILSPNVPFFAVTDRVVAKHLKLTTLGEIHLMKPFSKTSHICPQNPATAADIEVFVKAHQGCLLSKIHEQNLYDQSLVDSNRILVLAVGEQSSPLGGYFYHLITRLVQNNTNNTEFGKLNILWVEPQIFPNIYLVMDELHATLGIPNTLPAFGALNVTTMKGSWLDTSSINATSDKQSDAQNLKTLQNFLDGVINQTLVPVKIGMQAFVQAPVSQAVVENSEVILECIVENPSGDCLWLKDGRNIGYSLDRHPNYSWRGDRLTGDCSLIISAAQITRDSGEWVCEVTGDLENPSLTSSPVKLLIIGAQETPTPAKNEL